MNQYPPPQPSRTPPGLPGQRGRFAVMVALAAVAVGATVYSGGTAPAATEAADEETIVSVALSESPEPVVDGTTSAATVPTTTPAAVEATPSTDPTATADTAVSSDTGESVGSTEAGSTEAGAVTEDAPVAESASSITPDQPYTDDFTADSGNWRTMTGSWAVQAGTLVQSDPSGFDLINTLDLDLPAEYDVTVSMQAQGDNLGGGIVVGLSNTASRRGAYLIDFTAGGTFLRWGRYDVDTGIYKYLGGLNVGSDVAAWNTLRVKVAESESTVFFNGDPQGTFDPVVGGMAGLVTSESTVAFDDLTIEAL
ncbi:hypothetical protein BDK89_0351 [Ilumatobacter fluminis]|uniref:Uncharacterized protein n=2 Tax=Ilumatobacter fluminis TaxID=467091 RepID=A0A4R7HW83_9ACTN|nr:hypothetical protein BDK89_0351 [Ilumatobacter fluminis]